MNAKDNARDLVNQIVTSFKMFNEREFFCEMDKLPCEVQNDFNCLLIHWLDHCKERNENGDFSKYEPTFKYTMKLMARLSNAVREIEKKMTSGNW